MQRWTAAPQAILQAVLPSFPFLPHVGSDTRIIKDKYSCDFEDQSQVAIIGGMDHFIVRIKSAGRDVCR